MTQIQRLRSQVCDDDLFLRRITDFAAASDGKQIRILDAGCGLGRLPKLDGVDCHVTGVDYDHPLLRERTERRDDLDLSMFGDLRTLPLPQRSFDVIYSSWLLQRVRNVELVLDRMIATLCPGGMILLRITDRESAYGFCARVSPRWAHTLYWRWITQQADPGDGDTPDAAPTGPYSSLPVVYEPLVSHPGIHRYCLTRGLIVTEEYCEEYSLERFGRLVRPATWTLRGIAAMSRGRLYGDRSTLLFVIRKPENRFARVVPGRFGADS